VLADAELGHGLELRTHAIEEGFPASRPTGRLPGDEAAPAAWPRHRPSRRTGTGVRGAGPGPARGAAALDRGTSRPARHHVRSPAPPRPAGTLHRTSGPRTPPSRHPPAPARWRGSPPAPSGSDPTRRQARRRLARAPPPACSCRCRSTRRRRSPAARRVDLARRSARG
jgi:hypothetical protein